VINILNLSTKLFPYILTKAAI